MMNLGQFSIAVLVVWIGLPCSVRAADATLPAEGKYDSPDAGGETVTASDLRPAFAPLIRPAPDATSVDNLKRPDPGMDWLGLSAGTLSFLAVEHGFRLLTEPGTVSGLSGPYLRNYGRAVGNLHGWADGDEFYVNYVGHPMEGGVAGFIFAQNDRAYRFVEFGSSREYWRSRLRAAAFAWAFSTQFEIGPVSEASIGGIQAAFPQQGFVDHVITPTVGLAWMIGEDAVDKYVIERIEEATTNRLVRYVARSGLNPCRSFAYIVQGRLPWDRENRLGVRSYDANANRRYASNLETARVRQPSPGDSALVAPFELAVTFQPQRFSRVNDSASCLGGGATAGFRISNSWQLIADIGGCKMIGLETNLSGDSLTYMAGPRWNTRIAGPWSAYWQFLAGGNKVTEERMYPELKQQLERTAALENKTPPSHDDYTEAIESNGFSISTGGGVNYNFNPAVTLRVTELSYRRSWTAPLWGRDYSGGLEWSTGFVLRMGTW